MESLAALLKHLKRLLCRRGVSRERAEDLVQEAYLRMQAYCKEGREVLEPQAFLARTALNLAIDMRRHDQRSPFTADPIDQLHLIDIAPMPEDVLAVEQRLLQIQQQLDSVSECTRHVFFMHRIQGFSYLEIAERLGVSVSTVEKRIASAVTLLAMERERE